MHRWLYKAETWKNRYSHQRVCVKQQVPENKEVHIARRDLPAIFLVG